MTARLHIVLRFILTHNVAHVALINLIKKILKTSHLLMMWVQPGSRNHIQTKCSLIHRCKWIIVM